MTESGQPSPTYTTWRAMLARCEDEAHDNFDSYGGRGIRVCDRWKSFPAFLEDMGERPAGCTLDRIDSNSDYGPGKCQWATAKEQSRNRRNARLVTAFGRTQCVIAWSEETGVRHQAIYWRLDRGWKPEDAVAMKPNKARKYFDVR